MDLMSETPAIIEFGHYRIAPHRRELLADGLPIQLGGPYLRDSQEEKPR